MFKMLNSNPRFFCFSHIPKTAGTTFISVLERNFYGKLHRTSHGFYEKKLQPEQISWALNQGENHLRCLAGHSVSANLPFEHPDYDVIGITIIRDPIDRLISEYFYLQKMGFKKFVQKDWNGFLDEIAQSTPDTFFWNTQYRFLGLPINEFAKRINVGNLFVIPQHRFDEGLLLLQKRFFEFRDISYVSQNINPSRRDGFECPSWFIEKCMAQDVELFDVACRAFDSQLDNAFGERLTAAITAHRAQCFRRKVVKEPLRKLISRLNSLFMRW
jgi:hypothetical protein